MAKFKCLGTALTNENCLNEENKGRLDSRNAYNRTVVNLLFSHLNSKNINTQVHQYYYFAYCLMWA